MSHSHMQDLESICSEIWSEHGDVIGKYVLYFVLLLSSLLRSLTSDFLFHVGTLFDLRTF